MVRRWDPARRGVKDGTQAVHPLGQNRKEMWSQVQVR